MTKKKSLNRGAYKATLKRREKRQLPDGPGPIVHVPKKRRVRNPASLTTDILLDRLTTLEKTMAHHQREKESAEKYAKALNTLLVCCTELGLWKSYATFSRLKKSFEHLELGDVHEMFQPRKKQPGRQPDSPLLWELRFRIAVLVLAITIDQATEKDGAKKIYAELGPEIDRLKSDGRRGKKTKRPEQAVEKWVDKLDIDAPLPEDQRNDPKPAMYGLEKPQPDDAFSKIKFFFRLEARILQGEYRRLPPKKRPQWFKAEVNWLREEIRESLKGTFTPIV